MKRTAHSRAAARRHRRQEGAIMLVVMLILLTATAMASIALQATQTELRAAGSNRVAVQTQYVSEAAMSTTLAWVDAASMNKDFYEKQLLRSLVTANLPNMSVFGELPIDPANANWANRTRWQGQRDLLPYETSPLTVKDESVGATQQPDPIGTFGPRTAYRPGLPGSPGGLVDYVVDLYDCQKLPPLAAAGEQANDTGSGTPHGFQFYCVITARGNSYLPGSDTKAWTLASGAIYNASRFSAAHDMRASLITPVIFQ